MEYIKTVNHNDEPVFAIQCKGFVIYDPFSSECGRFLVNPEYYGLSNEQAHNLIALNDSHGYEWKC